MNEMRMAKFETLIEDINDSIKKRHGGILGMMGLSVFARSMSRMLQEENINIQTPLFMIFSPETLNDYSVKICNTATFELVGNDDTCEDPWASKYRTVSFKDAKTKIEAAKDFVKYCRDDRNKSEAYKFIFWSLMILSVENESSDEQLSLICDFVRMLRITDDELLDIIYAIKCVYNEVEEEYVFKTDTIPSVLGKLFNLYGNSDFTVE